MRHPRSPLSLFVITVLISYAGIGGFASNAAGGDPTIKTLTLVWTPSSSSPNIDGYRVYYGTASHSYNQHLDVGVTTSAVVPKAGGGSKYYYVVVAYKGSAESSPSNEVMR